MTTLSTVADGNIIYASHINQLVNLLTGTSGDTIDPRALPAATGVVRGAVVTRGEINVKDPAYGAVGTAGTDATAALQAAIDAAIGGAAPGAAGSTIKYLFDGVVATSGTHLTSAGATFTGGDTGKIVNIPGAGAGGTQYYGVMTYVSATTATLAPAPSTAIASKATVVYGTQVATRTALYSIYLPPGTYDISADLNIACVVNLSFIGAGPSTIIRATSTAVKHMIYANGVADCTFGNFTLAGDGTHDQVTEGFSLALLGEFHGFR